MKTIKYIILGIFSLFITVLLLKFTVTSYNYITIDFQPVDTTEVYNFGLTFFIQTIVLLAISFLSILNSIACFALASKYYKQWCRVRRNNQLLRHIEQEKYEQLITRISKTNIIEEKEDYVNNFLFTNKGRVKDNAYTQSLNATNDIVKAYNKKLERTTLEEALKRVKEYPNISQAGYKSIEFEPKNNTIPGE